MSWRVATTNWWNWQRKSPNAIQPEGLIKKKDALKSEYLKKAADYRASLHSQETSSYNELSDDELDAAAGGLLAREDIEELRKKKNELKQD